MNTYTYTAGACAIALVAGMVPVAVFAENGGGEDGARVQATATDTRPAVTSSEDMSEPASGDASSSEADKQMAEQVREQAKQGMEQVREGVKQQVEQIREEFKNQLEVLREGTTTPARSIEQLKQMIENRRTEIQDGLASTSPAERQAFEHASQVSVAVHALLASQDLLGGGIGQQVSDIAREVDDSVATTTNAEARIQSRGFFTRLFFGGDKQAASVISEQVAQNQDHIQTLTGLLSEASTTADVKAELESQIQAVQQEQTRLQDVAQSQSKLWGLFSWRLF